MMLSATRALVGNLRLRLGLHRLNKRGEVWNNADVIRRTMAKGLCVGTHPGKGEHNSPPIDPELLSNPNCIVQCDVDLAFFLGEYLHAPEGSKTKAKALECYQHNLQERRYVDASMSLIGEFLFGTTEKALSVMKAVRPAGKPGVDDWKRYETMLDTYEKICGTFSVYGKKHMISIANMCNAGVRPEDLAKAAAYACGKLGKKPPEPEFP